MNKLFFQAKKEPTWGLFLLILLGCLLASLPIVVGTQYTLGLVDANESSQLKWMQLTQVIFLMGLPSILFWTMASKRPWHSMGLDRKPSGKQLLFTTIAFVSSIPLINLMVQFNEAIRLPGFLHPVEQWMQQMETANKITMQRMLVDGGILTWMGNWVIAAVMAGVLEELLFRGTVQKLFNRSYKRGWIGVVLTAIIFSAIHLQFYGFIPRFALGALFGFMFLWSRNLWLAIYAHVLNNTIALIEVYLQYQDSQFEGFTLDVSFPIRILVIAISASIVFFSMKEIKKMPNL